NKLNKPLSIKLLKDLLVLGELPMMYDSFPSPTIKSNLNPWWISGIIAGEGSFTNLRRGGINKEGISVIDYTLIMEVSQKKEDDFILTAIQQYFNGGKIYHEARGVSKFRITQRIEILEILIPHFINYPLLGYKQLQYNIWLKIF